MIFVFSLFCLSHPRREAQQLGPHVRGNRFQALPVEAFRERSFRLGESPKEVGRSGRAKGLEVFLGHVELPLLIF